MILHYLKLVLLVALSVYNTAVATSTDDDISGYLADNDGEGRREKEYGKIKVKQVTRRGRTPHQGQYTNHRWSRLGKNARYYLPNFSPIRNQRR